MAGGLNPSFYSKKGHNIIIYKTFLPHGLADIEKLRMI
jgi:hypothetical protein